MKLISMTDFVLEQNYIKCGSPNVEVSSRIKSYEIIQKYANFLKQPLTLGMFVPCDEDWNVLEEPTWQVEWEKGKVYSDNLCNKSKTYQEAKDIVLFEGFNIVEDMYYSTKREFIWLPDNVTQLWRRLTFHTGKIDIHFLDYYDEFKTIQDLLKYNLVLTESAKKQIGL